MSFRGQELFNKISRKLGKHLPGDKLGKHLPAEVMDKVKKNLPNSKIVMGRAKRGIFAGRHIQFGNQISEDGGNKSRRTWKPNVQEKRLFSYVHDRHIRIKVTTHALRCIDKAGGIDEYLLNTPYRKMDTELGMLWKAKVERMYEELSNLDVRLVPPEKELKITKGVEENKTAKKDPQKERSKRFGKSKTD